MKGNKRVCGKCGRYAVCKINRTCKLGRQKLCIRCSKQAFKEWYAIPENAEKKREYQRRYRAGIIK